MQTLRRSQEQLRFYLQRWQENLQDNEALLRGRLLDTALDWLGENPNNFSTTEKSYIQASLNFRVAQQRQEENKRKVFIASLSAGLGIVSLFAGFAFWQWQQATEANIKTLINLDTGMQQKLQAIPLIKNLSPLFSDRQALTINLVTRLAPLREYKSLNAHNEAIKAFDNAIKQNNPENIYITWYGKGLALEWQGNYKEVIAAFKNAIATIPKVKNVDIQNFHSNILSKQSLHYRSLRNYKKALNSINEALKYSSSNPKSYNKKCVILANLKLYPEALEVINRAIEIALRLAWLNNRGNVYYDLKDYPKALAEYNEALRLDPNYAPAYFSRGIVYNKLSQYQKAISDYKEAIRLDNNYWPAITNIGLLMKK